MLVAVGVLVSLVVVAAVVLVFVNGRRRRRQFDRRAAVQTQAQQAEIRIDLLTRQTVQRMRDAVRSELRNSSRGTRRP